MMKLFVHSWRLFILASVFFGAVALFSGDALAAVKRGSKADVAPVIEEEYAPFVVTLGKAELINIEDEFSDVLVANPSIVDVSALNARKLYLVGMTIGDTNLFVLDDQGEVVRRIDVHVTYDLKAIQAIVDQFFPDENITVKAVHDQVVLTGTVSTPQRAQRVTELVGEYVGDLTDETGTADELINNMLDVYGEQQVTLRVKIVEASRSVVKELGLETRFNDPDELAVSTLFGLSPGDLADDVTGQVLSNAQLGLTQDPLAAARILADTGISGLGFLELTMNALEQESLINTLAEPNLTTVSGETAGFLAGGEFPVPVGRDRVGNLVIEFRPFGVSLNFRPSVLSDERISLQMETEVSSLNFEDGVPLTGSTSTAAIIPAFDVRRASTTVEVGSGGSIMIAGLLRSESTKGLTGLPGIKDAPILGDLMSSDSFLRDETEVMIIVTPYLVEPVQDDSYSQKRPANRDQNHLADMFAMNIRRIYRLREEDENLFEDDLNFGYLLN